MQPIHAHRQPQNSMANVNSIGAIIQKSFQTRRQTTHNSLAHSETLNSIPPNVGCSFYCDTTMDRGEGFAEQLTSRRTSVTTGICITIALVAW